LSKQTFTITSWFTRHCERSAAIQWMDGHVASAPRHDGGSHHKRIRSDLCLYKFALINVYSIAILKPGAW